MLVDGLAEITILYDSSVPEGILDCNLHPHGISALGFFERMSLAIGCKMMINQP